MDITSENNAFAKQHIVKVSFDEWCACKKFYHYFIKNSNKIYYPKWIYGYKEISRDYKKQYWSWLIRKKVHLFSLILI